jgi:hypothetical protein
LGARQRKGGGNMLVKIRIDNYRKISESIKKELREMGRFGITVEPVVALIPDYKEPFAVFFEAHSYFCYPNPHNIHYCQDFFAVDTTDGNLVKVRPEFDKLKLLRGGILEIGNEPYQGDWLVFHFNNYIYPEVLRQYGICPLANPKVKVL